MTDLLARLKCVCRSGDGWMPTALLMTASTTAIVLAPVNDLLGLAFARESRTR
jgi:hypothetical protein